jgi:CBS domain-containing protein
MWTALHATRVFGRRLKRRIQMRLKHCRDIMKPNVERCLGDATIVDVAKQMRDRNVGFLPVCDDSGRAIGVLTDRDLAVRVLAEGRDPTKWTARDVMTRDVVTAHPDDELKTAEDHMIGRRVERIVVTDENSTPVGVVSLTDIAVELDHQHAAKLLNSIATREAVGPTG